MSPDQHSQLSDYLKFMFSLQIGMLFVSFIICYLCYRFSNTKLYWMLLCTIYKYIVFSVDNTGE